MIHKYKLNNRNIVIDVNSGAIYIVDDCTYDILDLVDENISKDIPDKIVLKLTKKYKREDILECYDEIYKLTKEQLLFSKDDNYKYIDNLKNAPIKAMCLNVAHDCNLRCEYCFAAKGNFGGERELMPFDVGKKAIDFLIEKSGERRNLELDFFGGEPLLNFDVVKKIVEYARSKEDEYNKNFRFTITTNGILLTDDKIEFINKEMSNCVLSLDGTKETNDRLRLKNDGSGSYNNIIPKYQKLVSNRKDKDYYVRGTFTKYNLNFTKDAIHMADLGFKHISIEPVVSDPKLNYSVKEEDLKEIFNEYEVLSKELINRDKQGKGFNFFHFMVDLDKGPCAVKRLKGCGCGNEYLAVTPNGDIYPCHQFVGDYKWKMGNLKDETFNNDMKVYFSKANIYNKNECLNCWAKFFCSGGCNANNYQYEGDILKPHNISCKMQKKRLECAIMIQSELNDKKCMLKN